MRLPILSILALTAALAPLSRAADPTPTADEVRKELALKQEALARRYGDFEMSLIRLATRLEKSSKEDDRNRAARLKQAIAVAGKEDVRGKFDKLIDILKMSKGVSVDELAEAMRHQKMLAADIRSILVLVMDDDTHKKVSDEIASLRKILKTLDLAIRDQKVVRIQTEKDNLEKDMLAKLQVRVNDSTQNVAQMLGAPKKDKQPPSATEIAAAAALKGVKPLQDAAVTQTSAYNNIQQGKNSAASDDQDKSVRKMEEARRQLEEILRQLREEEIERVLAALSARCERMLQMQLAVYAGTLQIDANAAKTADKKPTRADEQKAAELSQFEDQIVGEVNKAIQLLEIEGSSIAFPEVFSQLRDDMKHVSRRLGKADVGNVTQLIQKDIVNTLREMHEAVQKAQQVALGGSGNPAPEPNPGAGKPKEPKLVPPVAELKMVRAMQVRVNYRTATYSDRYTGEQATVPDIQKEFNNLADRQKRIATITTVLPMKKD